MRWRDVCLIWLLADVLLAAGTVTVVLVSPKGTGDMELLWLVLGYGFLVTLPSLAAMLLFYAVYSQARKGKAYHVSHYILLILAINLLYWLAARVTNFYIVSFDIRLILCTTIAGLIALAFVHRRKVNRTLPVVAKDSPQ